MTPTMAEIARRIDAHLKRFEADPELNKDRQSGLCSFYYAGARYPGGPRIRVVYISYQGSSTLTKRSAIAYLSALDGGFVGTHYAASRQD